MKHIITLILLLFVTSAFSQIKWNSKEERNAKKDIQLNYDLTEMTPADHLVNAGSNFTAAALLSIASAGTAIAGTILVEEPTLAVPVISACLAGVSIITFINGAGQLKKAGRLMKKYNIDAGGTDNGIGMVITF